MPTMSDQRLIEVQSASEEVLRGKFLQAFRDTATLPGGNSAIYEYFVPPGEVVVNPLWQDVGVPVGMLWLQNAQRGAWTLDWQGRP